MSRGPWKSKEIRKAKAQNHELYAMKRSEDKPRHDVHCSVCGERKSWGQFMPGNPPVCCDCARSKTMGEQKAEIKVGTAAADLGAQLAPSHKNSEPALDLLGQGKELGGEGQTAQLALFES